MDEQLKHLPPLPPNMVAQMKAESVLFREPTITFLGMTGVATFKVDSFSQMVRRKFGPVHFYAVGPVGKPIVLAAIFVWPTRAAQWRFGVELDAGLFRKHAEKCGWVTA